MIRSSRMLGSGDGYDPLRGMPSRRSAPSAESLANARRNAGLPPEDIAPEPAPARPRRPRFS